MNSEDFVDVLAAQIGTCERMLGAKASEYATDDDRLHNFKVAAALKGETCKQALAGMMAKHTVSIYDMIRDDVDAPLEVWVEKISDHLNYLFLLKAIVVEEKATQFRTISQINPPKD